MQSQLRLHGISEEEGLVFLKPREGEYCIRDEDVHDVITKEGSKISCILLPGVQYLSGNALDSLMGGKNMYAENLDVQFTSNGYLINM